MFLKWIVKFLSVINANTRPAHVAAGIAWGLALALIPAGNLLWVALFVLTFFLKINVSMQMVFLGLGKLIVPLLQAGVHTIGLKVLSQPGLTTLFTRLNNTPIVPFTHFNNTLVAGGVLTAFISWLPLFLLALLLLKIYREHLREKIVNLKMVKAFLKSPLISKLWKASQRAGSLYGELGGSQ